MIAFLYYLRKSGSQKFNSLANFNKLKWLCFQKDLEPWPVSKNQFSEPMDHVSISAWEWKPLEQHRDLVPSPSQTERWLQVIMSGICKTSFRIRISRFSKRNSAKLSDSSSSSRSNCPYKSYGKSRFFDAERSYRTTNSSPSLGLIRSRFRTFLKAIARATSRRTKTRRLLKTTRTKPSTQSSLGCEGRRRAFRCRCLRSLITRPSRFAREPISNAEVELILSQANSR